MFLTSRAANGVLALVQVSLVAAAVGAADAGRFFRVITAAWLLAAGLKFGVDGILPRAIAEAGSTSTQTPAVRRQLGTGLALTVIGLPVCLAVLHVPLTLPVLVGLLAMAVSWAGSMVCSGLLKAHGRVARSGLAANVLWPLGFTLAPLPVLVAEGDWVTLTTWSAALSVGAFFAVLAVTVHALGASEVRSLAGRAEALPMDSDAVGAAVLSTLYELLTWMPVVLAAVINTAPVATAAIFTAARIAGVFSWGYQAVVAVLTPQLAGALARRDLPRVRSLIVRGGWIGGAITIPLAVAGTVASSSIMRAFDVAYAPFATTLAILILSRTIDAIAGPVGEALLVGRRTWLDTQILLVSVGAGLAVCVAVEPASGSSAPAIGAATTFVLANAVRLVVVRRLLARGWPITAQRPPWSIVAWPGWAVVAAAIGAAIVLRAAAGREATFIYVAATMAVLGAAGLFWVAFHVHGVRATLLSPIPVMAAVLLGEFALRPVGLFLDPHTAANGLLWLGFTWTDVARAAALGAACIVAFGGAFLLVWRVDSEGRRRDPPVPSTRWPLAPLALTVLAGCVLWGVLFVRLGGPAALESHPASLHLGQFGGGYGTFGMMLCLGGALVACWRWAREGSPADGWFALAALATGLAASIGLATRGPLIATVIACLVVVLRYRRPTFRHVIVTGLVIVTGTCALVFVGSVRNYSQVEPLPDAIRDAAHTPVLALVSAEVQEFDHLVALDELVPHQVPRLDGRSLQDVPAAFVPRTLWPAKPVPVDFELSRVLYGPQTAAGTPFTLPGEAYWNFSLPLALSVVFLLGLAGGWAWRAVSRRRSPLASVSSALIVGYSYLLLTRPLAAMLLMTAMAIAAAAVCCAAAGLWRPFLEANRLARRLWAGGTAAAQRAAVSVPGHGAGD